MLTSTIRRIISALRNPVPKGAPQLAQHRQAGLLAQILSFLILFSLATLLIVLIFDPHHDPARNQYGLLIGVLIVSIVLIYLLNRGGHYTLATGLLVLSAALSPWASFLFDVSILAGDIIPLTYVVFSVILSSILFPTYVTFALAGIQLIGIILVLLLSPIDDSQNWFSLVAFVFLTSMFSILANRIIQRDIEQIANQSQQLKASQALLREQSIRDYQTHLFNRRYLEETLEREIQRGARTSRPVGVIMLDVDHFKSINDELGHAAGDTVLKELAKFLSAQIRAADLACRFGGDEFVLVMPDASEESTRARAQELCEGVKCLDLPIRITLSLGVAVFPANGANGELVLKAADGALYQSKHAGGNRVTVAGK